MQSANSRFEVVRAGVENAIQRQKKLALPASAEPRRGFNNSGVGCAYGECMQPANGRFEVVRAGVEKKAIR